MSVCVGFVDREEGCIYIGCDGAIMDSYGTLHNGIKHFKGPNFVICFAGTYETFNRLDELLTDELESLDYKIDVDPLNQLTDYERSLCMSPKINIKVKHKDLNIKDIINLLRNNLETISLNTDIECDKLLIATFDGLFEITIFSKFVSYTKVNCMAIGSGAPYANAILAYHQYTAEEDNLSKANDLLLVRILYLCTRLDPNCEGYVHEFKLDCEEKEIY